MIVIVFLIYAVKHLFCKKKKKLQNIVGNSLKQNIILSWINDSSSYMY